MRDELLDEAGATLHLLDSLFGGTGRRAVRVAAGATIQDALLEHWPDEWDHLEPPPLVVVVNGRVERDILRALASGDHVAVYPRTGDPVSIGAIVVGSTFAATTVGGLVAGAIGMMVIGGAMYGLNALLAPDAPSIAQGHNERPHYAWDGVATEYRGYGATMPCVYGEQVVGGTAISYSVRSRRGRSILRLLLVLSHGPVESVAGFDRDLDDVSGEDFEDTNFRLNGTPVREWGDLVRVWTRRGEVNQRAIEGFNDEERSYAVGRRIRYSERTDPTRGHYTTRTPVHAVVLRFSFGQGLGWIDNTGEYRTHRVDLQYRFRRLDLPDEPANWSAWTAFSFSGSQTTPLPKDFEIEFPELRSYDIHVRRMTEEPIQVDGVTSRSRVELSDVIEVVRRDMEYPGLTLCALEIRAVDGLSGARPSTEVPLRGIRVLWPDGTDQDTTTHTRAWTRCPFRVAYDFLRNTDYGLGDATRYMRFNLADWRDASEHAAEFVDAGVATTLIAAAAAGATEIRVLSTAGIVAGDQLKLRIDTANAELVEVAEVRSDSILNLAAALAGAHPNGATVTLIHARYEWDGVLDGASSPWDTVQQILATARARLVKEGNDFVLVRAIPRDPVMLICEGNGADDFVETRENPRFQPNALDLQFWNRATRFQRDNRLVLAEDALIDSASSATFFEREALNPKEEQAFGISRPAQIDRHGHWRLRQLRLAPRGWACTLPLEAVVAKVGDVVDVAHRVVLATTWSGRALAAAASGTSTIRLDQPVTLESGVTYAVRVQIGTSTRAVRQITSAAGAYARGDVLTISGTWPGDVAAGATYALGVQGQETVPAEIVARALQEDFRVALGMKEYVEGNLADV